MVTLGLDLDGVVGDYTGEFRRFVSRYTGVAESLIPNPTSWNFADSGWPFTSDEYGAYHARAVQDGMFRSMAAIDGASEVLWWLAEQDVQIRVITHRLLHKGDHGIVVSDTVRWLDNHNIPYNDICFMGAKAEMGGVDLFIDDAPHNIEQLRTAGHRAVVFDAPYNEHLDGARVRSWAEARTFFSEHLLG